MHRTFKLVLLTLLALGVSGCGLPGRWNSTSFQPEVARSEFNFLGGRVLGIQFTKSTLIISQDHSYAAQVWYGENLIRRTGSWEVSEKTITFVDDKGFSDTYSYELRSLDRKLLLKETLQGTEVVLTFDRMPSP